MDGEERGTNTAAAIDFVMRNPRWRLAIQAHKALGLP
jgi:hypothetical protein